MNRLISASAGSGKTYALTTQYLKLLCTGCAPDSLLAATFTRKAAGEIFDRILKRLSDAALTENGLDELRAALGQPDLSAERCQGILQHLCRNLHRVRVGTLDSFFGRLCKAYRQEAGISGDVRMIAPDSPRCLALQKEAVQAALAEMGSLEDAGALFQILTAQKAPSSVVPKLFALLRGLSETVGEAEAAHWETLQVPDCPPQSATDRALADLEAYFLTLTDKRWSKAVTIDLAHAHNRQWEQFLKSGLAKPCFLETYTYYSLPIPEEITGAYRVLLAAARHTLLAALKEKTLALRDVHARFSAEFARRRKAEGLILFSETPALLSRAGIGFADTARRLDAPLDHLLLDEFQDTSDAQWGLLKGFALQAALSPGSVFPGSVFVVGDAKQAIYGWRGGRAEIFEQVAADIPAMSQETLEQSYRSSSVVLDIVNAVFPAIAEGGVFQDGADSGKTAWHKQAAAQWGTYFKPHVPARTLPGFAALCVSPVPNTPVPADSDSDTEGAESEDADWNAAGASYHLARCAERIAAEVQPLLKHGRSVGVLVRTNKTLAQITDLLRALGVPVSSEGVGKIADDPAVELIFSGLLLADHPGHSAAAYHVATSPLAAQIGLTAADWQETAKSAAASTAIRRRLVSEGYAGVLCSWAAALAPFGTERTARRLEQLVEIASELDAQPPMRPAAFVRAVRESSAENPGAAPVRVMTINRAKGLEFDAVFLPDLEWKTRTSDTACVVQRASAAAISNGAALIQAVHARPNTTVQTLAPELLALAQAAEAEELTGLLCLLYVAMTRPRHALYLYAAPHKLKKDGTPEKPGIKPAAILRAALADGPADPRQGSGWTVLKQVGQSDWVTSMPPPKARAVAAPPEPVVPRFRQSDGLRRSALPHEFPRPPILGETD